MAIAVSFPSTIPSVYESIGDEPTFDPAAHLALEAPAEVRMLTDLGYSEAEIAGKATPVAVSSPFRILSDEGVTVMLDIARRLKPFCYKAGDRIENAMRGGCYRSAWLRDLCTSQDLNAHLEKIYGIEIAPHPMPLQLGHINYEPSTLEAPIDKWHHDTLPIDFVMTVTDPAKVDGGRFEYFEGTRAEAEALRDAGQVPPRDRVVTPELPGAGWAIALHGDMVVHRAAPLHSHCERISLVNGYVALDRLRDEQSATEKLLGVDPPAVVSAEWARFAAWRAQGRLESLIDSVDFDAGAESVADALEGAVSDVQRAIAELRLSTVDGHKQDIHHYERS